MLFKSKKIAARHGGCLSLTQSQQERLHETVRLFPPLPRPLRDPFLTASAMAVNAAMFGRTPSQRQMGVDDCAKITQRLGQTDPVAAVDAAHDILTLAHKFHGRGQALRNRALEILPGLQEKSQQKRPDQARNRTLSNQLDNNRRCRFWCTAVH